MAPDPSPLRPTKAVVVDAICDILRPVIRDLWVLELYAGTGRVSRALVEEGAAGAWAVDRREAPDDLPEEVHWLQRDVEELVREGPPGTVEVVYLDPPYGGDGAETLLPRIGRAEWLADRGVVLAETDLEAALPETVPEPSRLALMRKRRYGGTRLWVYQRGRDEPGYRDE